MARFALVLGLLMLSGCFPMPLTEADRAMALVSNNPFGAEAPPAAPTRANYAPGDQELTKRVIKAGNELLTANPQIALRPLFATIGVEQMEIFHVDTSLVYVTAGLVKQCRSNAELAAVLAAELGKMVAEREAKVGPDARSPEKLAPIRLQGGNGLQGRDTDMTAVAELAKFEKANPKTPPRNLPRPDPTRLARAYLEKAGYQAADLDTVNPLLQAAERNVALERHFKGTMPQSSWTP
jgi:hypothetical protein